MGDVSVWLDAGGRFMTRMEGDNLGVQLRKQYRRIFSALLASLLGCVKYSFFSEGFRRGLGLSVSLPLQRKKSDFSDRGKDCRGLAPPPLPSFFGTRCPRHPHDVLWTWGSLTRTPVAPVCQLVMSSLTPVLIGQLIQDLHREETV